MKRRIYTKTGDDGTTSLPGGERVKKNDARLEALGSVDELNSWLGLIRSVSDNVDIENFLIGIQKNLFTLCAQLVGAGQNPITGSSFGITEAEIQNLEAEIDRNELLLQSSGNFILPGGSVLISYCHIARTVCRRAERRIVQLHNCPMDNSLLRYINRLSDYLFVLSRRFAFDHGISESPWISGK